MTARKPIFGTKVMIMMIAMKTALRVKSAISSWADLSSRWNEWLRKTVPKSAMAKRATARMET